MGNATFMVGIRSDFPGAVMLQIMEMSGIWTTVQILSPDDARNIGAALMDCANEVDMGAYRQEGEHPVDRLIREINTSAQDSAARAEEALDGPYSAEDVEGTVHPDGGSRAEGPMHGFAKERLYTMKYGEVYWSTYAPDAETAVKRAEEENGHGNWRIVNVSEA